jgi:endonuclease/exonuclease/phosphatase family metal-dependent hydrolase
MFDFYAEVRRSLSKGPNPKRRDDRRPTRLRLESLEERCMLSVTPALLQPINVTVMTQNLYVGSDEAPLIAAAATGDPTQIVNAATQFVNNVINVTKYGERLAKIASEITQNNPGLVGLQEVSKFDFGSPVTTGASALVTPSIDYLQVLMTTLHQYTPVIVNNEVSISAYIHPAMDASLEPVTLTDRDVILVRNDLLPSVVASQEGHFRTNLQFTVAGSTINVTRGWESVDMNVSGKAFRFLNTHLESPNTLGAQVVQLAQAAELLTVPALTLMPVVLVGDFNAPAGSPLTRPGALTYQLLVTGGFLRDSWTAVHPRDPGVTWGNLPNLSNSVPLVVDPQRIDLVLTRGLITTRSIDRIGINPLTDKTISGLWPSDHAGVVAMLTVQPTLFISSTVVTALWNRSNQLWNAVGPALTTTISTLAPLLQSMQGSLSLSQLQLPLLQTAIMSIVQLDPTQLNAALTKLLRSWQTVALASLGSSGSSKLAAPVALVVTSNVSANRR